MIRIPFWFLTWPRRYKQAAVVCVDAVLCALALWGAVCLRLDEWVPWSWSLLALALGSVVLALPWFVGFGLYRAIFRYSGMSAFMAIGKAIGIYTISFVVLVGVLGVHGVPRSVALIQPLLFLCLVGGSRAWVRHWLGGLSPEDRRRLAFDRVLIFGAGSAGRQLAAVLSSSAQLRVVGYVDDDERLHGHVLNGVRIYAPNELSELAESGYVSLVLMAIPSVSRTRRNEILEQLRSLKIKVRTLPGLEDLARGCVDAADVRELDVEDLLGREPVPPNPLMLAKKIQGKVVMVTGAGGSIGSELCRQIIKSSPSVLLLVELTEFALYSIHAELERLLKEKADHGIVVVPLLGNVRDAVRMGEILATWKPHTLYHAAAYKHVPLVEHNPAEGVKNNVHGTLMTALQAVVHGVSDFVLVSTDKAVRPTNIMGTSKRLAEMVLQAQAQVMAERQGQTRFSMVRFGNVLGSSGSVVPLFRRQIEEGGPITLTDERITRYFMTIPEAAQLVIQAGAMAKGGDVFVLDMGEPVKIMDLASRMVALSGMTVKDEENPDGDIEIQITGLRPGEKLYEELLIGDNPLPTLHPLIMKAHEDFLPWDQLLSKLNLLNDALDLNDVPRIRGLLQKLVPGYQPDGEVVDWVWRENERQAA
ncbi:MAG: polysaccharide biosynthesis protein [Comamonadaceae bacterium PBBC1]|uniref:polysaccharide biosynthesis protein n=1 Tax=Limnohabitans sp. 2KL-3 TaxID=1100700 RepID=UPI000AA90C8C|nr:nucleoside-diphosphate sugar epimerase/dehydratase [Limnohabitans sp. 2KL-3]OYU11114.1 MAG: polysaccharide biosynthesis protein [Comamonadaceae bacterium PBBC1]